METVNCSKKAITRRLSELPKTETNRLAKLNTMLDVLIRGEDVQNRQLQTWLSEDEYEQITAEWDTQKHFREEFPIFYKARVHELMAR